MKNLSTKQFATLFPSITPTRTFTMPTFTMPADFAKNQRLIYYSKKTNKQYDIKNN